MIFIYIDLHLLEKKPTPNHFFLSLSLCFFHHLFQCSSNFRLCRGPRATWAWRLFMSHLPSFARLTTTDVADATLPSHTLHGTGELPQQSVTTTTEELRGGKWRWRIPKNGRLKNRGDRLLVSPYKARVCSLRIGYIGLCCPPSK